MTVSEKFKSIVADEFYSPTYMGLVNVTEEGSMYLNHWMHIEQLQDSQIEALYEDWERKQYLMDLLHK